MRYEEALAYMEGLRRFGIKLGNERFTVLLERLGNPHTRYGIAHVTGTKGKGSTTAMIAAILRGHGFRVGGYFSPYVYDVSERVQVDGEMISHDDLARLITDIAPHVEALAATELGQSTEFELKTAVGFRYFAERAVELAAVEVGLGGRLDATNVVTPHVSVITNVGLDHTHILGDTYAKIAYEKAGIIKPGVPVITAAEVPEALATIQEVARGCQATLAHVHEAGSPGHGPLDIELVSAGDTFAVRTPTREYPALRTRLVGHYQQLNAACAVAAVENVSRARGFEVCLESVREGLATAWLPGRMQIAGQHPLVVLDGAHNAMAARALAAEVAAMPHDRLMLVVGMLAGHEPKEFVAELAPSAWKVYATRPTWRKGQSTRRVAQAARQHCPRVEEHEPPLAATQAALRDAGPDDLVLVTGSFYTVGDVRPGELRAQPISPGRS